MSEAVGQDPEDRRHEQLGGEEQGREHADHARIDPGAADPFEVGQVVRQQRAGQAGAQAQGECAEQDGAE